MSKGNSRDTSSRIKLKGEQRVIAEEIKKGLLSERPDIIAIALFGSFATGEKKYNDIDLLVVAPNLPKSIIARVEDIVAMRESVPRPLPLDIIPVPRKECIGNFRGHNPLYLDIALDGKIIYDPEGFLRDLIDETRKDIESKGIKRIGTSWRFPVRYREPTPLSSISNSDWGKTWLEVAKRDLRTAEASLQSGVFENCVYHSQQVVEKAIKSILSCFGIFEKTHFVTTLLEEALKTQELSEEWIEQLTELARISKELEPHESLSRYPREIDNKAWIPSREYNEEFAKTSLEQARSAIKVDEEFVRWWFRKKPETKP